MQIMQSEPKDCTSLAKFKCTTEVFIQYEDTRFPVCKHDGVYEQVVPVCRDTFYGLDSENQRVSFGG